MRESIIYGNGASCDKCGEMLYPKNVTKIKFVQLSRDPQKASQGSYTSRCSRDLCENCYKKVLNFIDGKPDF